MLARQVLTWQSGLAQGSEVFACLVLTESIVVPGNPEQNWGFPPYNWDNMHRVSSVARLGARYCCAICSARY
eukprot:2476240-Rhodomonas_salina.6